MLDKLFKPIVFVNSPIENEQEDVIGLESKVNRIEAAISEGAKVIGIIADYGAGKSSLTQIIKDRRKSKKKCMMHKDIDIDINMWDSINANCDTLDLIRSFLFQLASGKKTRFGSHINKTLSKNYGNISFSSNSPSLAVLLLISIFIFVLAFAYIKATFPILSKCSYWILALMGALVIGIVCILKHLTISFSSWKKDEKLTIESSDFLDAYANVCNSFSKRASSYIYINDLDRIESKKQIVDFLKEVYRFEEISKNKRKNIVFLISIKPEDKLDGYVEGEHLYSKIFDTTVYLNEVHYEDYDSLLISMFRQNADKRMQLEELLKQIDTQNADSINLEESIPNSFKWIKYGSNLTLRALKERLNYAIDTCITLINKSYQRNPAIEFRTCAAVAYLFYRYPILFRLLVEHEKEFEQIMANALKDLNELNTDVLKTIRSLLIDELTPYVDEKYSSPNKEHAIKEKIRGELDIFASDFATMIIERVFNEDYRMYFYTYPKGSLIKTTDERTICNYLYYPNMYDDYATLNEAVSAAFKEGRNKVICDVLRKIDRLPECVLKNDTLFIESANVAMKTLFSCFKENNIDKFNKGNNDQYWGRILKLNEHKKSAFCKEICGDVLKTEDEDKVNSVRDNALTAFGTDIILLEDLFMNPVASIISEEEIKKIGNSEIAIKLINPLKLSEENAEYICELIKKADFNGNDADINKAKVILKKYYNILENATTANAIFDFMKVNSLIDLELFNLSHNNVERSKFIQYFNAIKELNIPDEYYVIADNKMLTSGLDDSIIDNMLGKGLYKTALCHYANSNSMYTFKRFESNAKEIVEACAAINEKHKDVIQAIRFEAFLKRGIKNYDILFAQPYPFLTKEEYETTKDLNKVIKLIDIDRIDENEYEQLLFINCRHYSKNQLFNLLEHLFNHERPLSIKEEIFKRVDFKSLGMKTLNLSKKKKAFLFMQDLVDINDKTSIIDFFMTIGCFIESIEPRIQDDKEYSNLISKLDDATKVTYSWLKNNYIDKPLSVEFVNSLYEKKDYKNCIIGTMLRTNALDIDSNIESDIYIDVYKNVGEVVPIMTASDDFSDLFQNEAIFTDFTFDDLKPFIYKKQHRRFFEYMLSLDEQYREYYLKNCGNLASDQEGKAFRQLVCREINIPLFKNGITCNTIRNKLHGAQKASFTKWYKKYIN